MNLLRLFFVIIVAWLLVGCEKKQVPFAYRPDVQQGNVVTKEMLGRLEPGMEKRKVRFLLGTPLIVDTFNQNRWDYIYTFNPLFGDIVQRRVSLFFEDQRLKRIDGDVKKLADIEPPTSKEKVVTVPRRTPDDGIVVTLLSPINPFAEDEPAKQAGKDEFDAESDGEQTGGEEPGFFERMKNAFDSDDASGAEETENTAEPTAAPDSDATQTAAAKVQADADDDQPGIFERMKKVFESDDPPAAADSVPEPDAQPEADAVETQTAAMPRKSDSGDEQPGFFERMKKAFEPEDSSETQAPAVQPGAQPEPEAVEVETAAMPQEPEPGDEQPDFFERMKKAFSGDKERQTGETAPAPAETAKAPEQTEQETKQETEGSILDQVKRAFTPSAPAEGEAVGGTDATPPAAREPVPATTADTQDEDGGFFRRLAERFRLSIGLDEGTEDTLESAPTAGEPAPSAE